MAPAAKTVLDAALALPAEDRAELADRLWASLDPDPEIDSAWVEEIERRIKDFDEGRSRGIPADEVFKAIRERGRT